MTSRPHDARSGMPGTGSEQRAPHPTTSHTPSDQRELLESEFRTPGIPERVMADRGREFAALPFAACKVAR